VAGFVQPLGADRSAERLAGTLPPDVLHRPKKGFGIPIVQWSKEDLAALARDTLGPDRLRTQGLFNPHRVQALLN
jgi:asparagine synthase (glutamine-hydrolysing)